MSVGVATSADILGPYVSPTSPLVTCTRVGNIDPHLWNATKTSAVYLYWKVCAHISCAYVALMRIHAQRCEWCICCGHLRLYNFSHIPEFFSRKMEMTPHIASQKPLYGHSESILRSIWMEKRHLLLKTIIPLGKETCMCTYLHISKILREILRNCTHSHEINNHSYTHAHLHVHIAILLHMHTESKSFSIMDHFTFLALALSSIFKHYTQAHLHMQNAFTGPFTATQQVLILICKCSVEAPWIVKADSYHYLFYSGNFVITTSYSVGAARSANGPLGPFEKNPANPILKTNSRWWAPGHCSVLPGMYCMHERLCLYACESAHCACCLSLCICWIIRISFLFIFSCLCFSFLLTHAPQSTLPSHRLSWYITLGCLSILARSMTRVFSWWMRWYWTRMDGLKWQTHKHRLTHLSLCRDMLKCKHTYTADRLCLTPTDCTYRID